MRVLVACEFSGIVRDAFISQGVEAVSCDIEPTEKPGPHIQDDVLNHLKGWDLIIAHPPCTHLALSGAQWMRDKDPALIESAVGFAWKLLTADSPRICLENPRSILSTRFYPPEQKIHPWMFGHPERKETWLWLQNLPLLKPTRIVEPLYSSVHYEPPGPDRAKNRSRTFQGIADAMAEQWGSLE